MLMNLLRAGIALGLVVVLGSTCFGGGGEKKPPEYLGNQGLHAAIEESSNCVWLQEQFEVAWERHEAVPAGTKPAREATSFMQHIDARMEKVGCYGDARK